MDARLERLAADLADAWRSSTQIPLPGVSGPASRDEAFAVQDRMVELIGDRIAGWKIGAAVKAVQDLEGHDGPIIGWILAERVYHSPADVPARFAGSKNGNGAAFVFGPPVQDWQNLPLATLPIDARIDEVPLEVYTGVQRYDPVAAVAEIANALAARGIGLKAGDFVSTGSATVPVAIRAGQTLVATFDGLPSLRLTLT